MVTYDRLLMCMLKAIDKEADLVLFTSDVNAESVGDEVVDVVVHVAGMTGRCEVAGGVVVGAEVADDALGEVRPLCHGCILRCAHVPPVCFTC